jgi:ankyrin repeat protein
MRVQSKLVGAVVAAVGVAVATTQGLAQAPSLVDAARAGDRAAVRSILAKRPAEAAKTTSDGTTPLHYAVQRDDVEMVDALLKAGADAKAVNRYGATPLFVACQNGNAAIIERLLKAGADPNSKNPDGETALMTAARTGKVDAVKLLLARGADAKAVEGWRGQTALMWAAAENHTEVAQTLIEAGADVNARSNGGFTPLLFAVRAGKRDVVNALLAKGANPNDAIPAAAPRPSTPNAGGPPPNATTGGAIGNAAGGRLAETGDPLTQLFNVFNTGNRANGRTGPGMTALVMAILNGHFELAADLLDRGADPNAAGPGWTALHQVAWTRRPPIQHGLPPAVQTGKMDSLTLAKKLLDKGANPNARMTREPADGARNVLNRIGSTPFLQAAKLADIPYMKLLLEHKADPTITTLDGATPLMAASGVGIWHTGESAGKNAEALDAAKLLVELGADVNAVDGNGDTALHGAAYRGAKEIAQLLIDHGAKINVVNKIGWTPWIIADGVFYPNTFNRDLDTAELLLTRGADKTLGKRRDIDLPPTEALAAAGQTPR